MPFFCEQGKPNHLGKPVQSVKWAGLASESRSREPAPTFSPHSIWRFSCQACQDVQFRFRPLAAPVGCAALLGAVGGQSRPAQPQPADSRPGKASPCVRTESTGAPSAAAAGAGRRGLASQTAVGGRAEVPALAAPAVAGLCRLSSPGAQSVNIGTQAAAQRTLWYHRQNSACSCLRQQDLRRFSSPGARWRPQCRYPVRPPSLAADEAGRAGAPGASGRRPKEAMRGQPGCLRRAARAAPRSGA